VNSPTEGSKQHLLFPNVNLQITLNENLPSNSCKSTTLFSLDNTSSTSKSLSHTSLSSVCMANSLRDLLENSWLTNLHCVSHNSLSMLKIPCPRKSPRISVKGFPLGLNCSMELRKTRRMY